MSTLELLKSAGLDPANLPDLELMQVGPAPAPVLSEWQKARLGKITGSQFNRIKRSPNGKDWSEGAQTYMAELLFEWITQMPADNFTGSKATDWGNEKEPEAITKYEQKIGKKVKRGGFYVGKQFAGLVGCTPDAVGKRALEVKSPYGPKAHINTLLTRRVPAEYVDQVDGHMLITGKEECDFLSYDPRIGIHRPDLELVLIEVEKNEFRAEDLEGRLYDFEQELIKNLDKLESDWRSKINKK